MARTRERARRQNNIKLGTPLKARATKTPRSKNPPSPSVTSSQEESEWTTDEDEEDSECSGDEEELSSSCEKLCKKLLEGNGEGDGEGDDLCIPEGAMEEVLERNVVKFTIRAEGTTAASKKALQNSDVRKMIEELASDSKELLGASFEYKEECDESIPIPVTASTSILVAAVAEFAGEATAKRLPLTSN